MNPNQVLWEKGDFRRIAESMRASGDALVASFGDVRGLDVLDLGCGDGTTALPAARLGARVVGVDVACNLVEAGNRRARAEALEHCRFEHGDASELRALRDGSFDLVVSLFGAMFAPRPMDVAREMVRAPGAVLARDGAALTTGTSGLRIPMPSSFCDPARGARVR